MRPCTFATSRTTPEAADDHDRRSDALSATIDEHEADVFRAKVDELTARLPADSPVAAFERACAFDSTGHPDEAVPCTGWRSSSGSTAYGGGEP